MCTVWCVLLLAATIPHHLQACRKQHPETVALVEKAFYVDDLIIGVSSVEKAIQVYEEARKIFSEAGMEIRKWASKLRGARTSVCVGQHRSREGSGGRNRDESAGSTVGAGWRLLLSIDEKCIRLRGSQSVRQAHRVARVCEPQHECALRASGC